MNEHHAKPHEVSPGTAKRLIDEGALLVDVREAAEIAAQAYDVPEVIAIPLGQLPARLAEIPQGRNLIIACKGGGRSMQATHFLMKQGYQQVANLQGGIMSWASQGLPVKGDAGSAQQTNQNAGSCCGGTALSNKGSCCEPASAKTDGCC